MNQEKSASNTQPKHWHLYIIENRLGQFYTGITTDVERRLAEHSNSAAKGAKALRGKGPLILRFVFAVGSKSAAASLEYWVKQQSRRTKLAIIDGSLPLPSDLS
ncbi:GIY-YIG nuclease family protein [Alteromonas sp. ASW11-36]|uniref:GIY-YIG nuclease family protein n=1 Tax=Alteromonas arenosi TaxID=3055817 RepID=A0ABT7STU6_9ALTE|nr:GIY-YIG nuclease family protein [Alteromonas sp. ASW11-36]MDM7859615.1 GIY-YIG nuclease family protein [Alteromonas sp. ASW11-36]